MEYSHIGWTPCISGHLNFGLMTPGIFGGFTNNSFDDKKRTTINYGYKHQDDHHARRIMLQSKVDWKDDKSAKADGNFRVILTAETNETNNLDGRCITGSVYIYPLTQEPPVVNGTIDLPWFHLIHDANRKITEYRERYNVDKNPDNWEVIKSELNEIYDKLITSLDEDDNNPIKEHYYKVNFKVNCRGLTELCISSETEPGVSYIILRQAFYYIKYSLHSHKHHYAEEDSLTTIIQKEISSKNKNEVGLRLIGQLKRELTSIKRTYSSGGSKVFCDEQGIIAYMKSLYRTLLEDNYLTTHLYERELVYLNSMQNSFDVQIEKQTNKTKKISDIKNNYRAKLALVFSGISILWLTVLQHFTNFSPLKVNSSPATFTESLLFFITVITCLFATYKRQVNGVIKNTLSTDGLRTWVEQYYMTKDEEFNNNLRKKNIQAFMVVVITAAIFFLLPILIKLIDRQW